jgi:hypothetical protein
MAFVSCQVYSPELSNTWATSTRKQLLHLKLQASDHFNQRLLEICGRSHEMTAAVQSKTSPAAGIF